MARHTLTSRDNWRGNAIRVVAVEGNGLFRELLSTELGMQGFDVTVFATADALLSAPETATAADVIVLEYLMYSSDVATTNEPPLYVKSFVVVRLVSSATFPTW